MCERGAPASLGPRDHAPTEMRPTRTGPPTPPWGAGAFARTLGLVPRPPRHIGDLRVRVLGQHNPLEHRLLGAVGNQDAARLVAGEDGEALRVGLVVAEGGELDREVARPEAGHADLEAAVLAESDDRVGGCAGGGRVLLRLVIVVVVAIVGGWEVARHRHCGRIVRCVCVVCGRSGPRSAVGAARPSTQSIGAPP